MILRRLQDETEQQYRERVKQTAAVLGYKTGWISRSSPPDSRAFCPTGKGGGVKNDCSSSDGTGARDYASMPKSFPRGSEKFREAVDSVAPDPKRVWDRSKGLAETPPKETIARAADEQTSSGKSLTPEAEQSYASLVDEIGRQYEALVATGLKVRAWRGEGEPYGDPPGSTKPNSDKMREEVAKTGEFSFFMTEKGFGTGAATPDHPMLRETKYKTADGEPMIANDLFRVVHDMVAHVRGGYSFSTNGEYNGMLTHASTLPEGAWPALFAETFGQNAVYEQTGNYSQQNAYASKVGPEIIKAELAKRGKKSSRADGKTKDSDEPLGYQHLKSRPWLLAELVKKESRAFCPTGEGGGQKNDCSSKDGGDQSLKGKALADSMPKSIPADSPLLTKRVPFAPTDRPNSDFVTAPSDEAARAALNKSQREKYGLHRELEEGYPMSLRIDINAFENKNTYVVTAHEKVDGLTVGDVLGYDNIVRLSGPVTFKSKEDNAALVAAGHSKKSPIATVTGAFASSKEIPDDIDSWTPVGYDPKKAAYFYDKRTGDEVVGGVDSISVGNSVFVRKPQYAKNPRNAAKQYRGAGFWGLEPRAFCPTGEGGGVDNSCATGEGGTATKEPSGDRWSSNDSMTWPETSKDSSGPPMGDGRYGSINVSSPKKVKETLDAAGVDPKLAPMIAGGSDGSDVFVRPAPDFSMEFPGSKVTPVMFAFERDFAGVESGLHGSSVIGVTASGEAVVYHSTVNVDDAVKNDDAKRHAAAREFYRSMTASVEAARKAGVSRLVLSAAGNSEKTSGSPWRGYTIWPRMGFDAPLSSSIKAKLPPDLSHAKSLLDLHATQEGTRWWRDNGEDIDVSFDLKDRSSPQSKIMDRFIKKFGESRREMPLGSGGDWLSPEDLVRLDEMWQEIWDDGELDDYEWTETPARGERRSDDCGRDGDGRFGQDNKCQEDAGDGKQVSEKSYHDAATPRDFARVRDNLSRGDINTAAKNIKLLLETMPPSSVARELGFTSFDVDRSFDKSAAKKNGMLRFLLGDPAESAARHLAKMAVAAEHVPAMKSAAFNFSPYKSWFDALAAEVGAKTTGAKLKLFAMTAGVKAACHLVTGEISVIEDRAGDEKSLSAAYERGWFSTGDASHYIIHEYAHKLQHDVIAGTAKEYNEGRIDGALIAQYRRQAEFSAGEVIRQSPTFLQKAEALSTYGMTDPLELAVEYWTAVTLGYADNDPDFDRFLRGMEMPKPSISRLSQPKFHGSEWGIAPRKKSQKKRS